MKFCLRFFSIKIVNSQSNSTVGPAGFTVGIGLKPVRFCVENIIKEAIRPVQVLQNAFYTAVLQQNRYGAKLNKGFFSKNLEKIFFIKKIGDSRK